MTQKKYLTPKKSQAKAIQDHVNQYEAYAKDAHKYGTFGDFNLPGGGREMMAKAERQAGGRSELGIMGRGRSIYATQSESRRVTVAQITSALGGYSLFGGGGPGFAGGNGYGHRFVAGNQQPRASIHENEGNIGLSGHHHSSSQHSTHHANPHHGASHHTLTPQALRPFPTNPRSDYVSRRDHITNPAMGSAQEGNIFYGSGGSHWFDANENENEEDDRDIGDNSRTMVHGMVPRQRRGEGDRSRRS